MHLRKGCVLDADRCLKKIGEMWEGIDMTIDNKTLFALVDRGDLAGVTKALEAGASAQTEDRFGVSLTHRAAAGGHAELLRLLLARGATADCTSDVGNTPLMLAAANGHLPVVELLLAEGVDPERENRWGYRAAAWADWSASAADIKAVIQAAQG